MIETTVIVRTRARPNGIPPLLLAASFLLATLGVAHTTFGGLTSLCEELGLCDPPPPAPVSLAVLCDTSTPGPCTPENLRSTLAQLLPDLSGRNRSRFTLWGLGETGAASHIVYAATVTLPSRGSIQAVRFLAERWARETTAGALAAATPLFRNPVHRSPIAITIEKMAIADADATMPQVLALVTDGREYSGELGDWECLPPSVEVMHTRLRQAGLLPPGSVHAITVFAFMDFAPIDGARCPSTLPRFLAVRNLWQDLLRNAGADVVFSTGPPPTLNEILERRH